jgi:hypothetical protein
VKTVAQKLKMNYAQALKDPRTKASYGKMKGGAFWKDFGRGFGNGFIGTANIAKGIATQDTDLIEKGANRVVAGKMTKQPKMMLKDIKQICKQHKIKLSSNGKPFNKKQLIEKLQNLSGGGIKSAKRWADFAVDTAKQGIGLYKMLA